ncbi:hypothetical protein QE152_g29949 [Popillia japonica]|uniref:Uncharacterized protein n=1 Tax=Popillia japonica TaxID=7064 RepID=A0AAW1JFT3_POPJA
MAISPIFKLYETQDKSNVQANSPVKKKRKRECKPAENVKESGLSKEMWDVLKSMTQAEENEIAQEMQHKNAEAISQIECELNEKTGNWPASCYKNTVTVDRKVIRERKGDVAVVVSPNSPTSGQALEQIKTNFPEALPLLEENLEEGRIEYVKTKTETILSKGSQSKGETSRVLYMLPYAIDPAGINDLRKLYDTIGQLKEAMAEQNTKKIKLVALGNLDSGYHRPTEGSHGGTEHEKD